MRRRIFPLFVSLACAALFSSGHAQVSDARAKWGLSAQLDVNVPMTPESFSTYWTTSAGTGLELAWFPGKAVGIFLGAHYDPFLIDKGEWTGKLEPKLEGAARLGFDKGTARLYSGSLGMKFGLPSGNRSFAFFMRFSGEYAYWYQQNIRAAYAFPAKIVEQEEKLGQSQSIYGGRAGLGAEVKLNRRWGLALETAFRYFTTVKDPSPPSDLLILSMIQPEKTGKGFISITTELVYYFGFTGK
jgi:hypothetical protein